MKNRDLPISQLPLAAALDGSELLPFAAYAANGAAPVSLLAAFIRQGMETTEHAGQTYATKTELSGYVKDEMYEALLSTVDEMYEALTSTLTGLANLAAQMKTKLDTIPTIPESDGKTYGLSNGAWVEIASETEEVAAVTKETEQS